MNHVIGFDRLLEITWLDLVASRFAATGDVQAAFDETAPVVAATTGPTGASRFATAKTMTMVARIWLKVPDRDVALRDAAAAALLEMAPADRMAVHWAMCQLAYPFYLDATAIAGRNLDAQGAITVATLRGRLSETWGARAVIPVAARKVLGTWIRWGVVQETNERGRYDAVARVPVGAIAARLVAEARVMAEPNGAIDMDTLQRSPDLFPFVLPELRPLLQGSRSVAIHREGGQRWVLRATV